MSGERFRPAFASASRSTERRTRSLDRARSFESFRTSPFVNGLLLRVRDLVLRFARRSLPLLDDDDELEDDDDELDELDREPELRDEELDSEELLQFEVMFNYNKNIINNIITFRYYYYLSRILDAYVHVHALVHVLILFSPFPFPFLFPSSFLSRLPVTLIYRVP